MFKAFPIAELCTLISRGISPAYDGEGIPVLSQKCIRGNRVLFDVARITNPRKKKIPNEKIVCLYDVLVNSTGVGTLGRVAQVKELNGHITVDSHVSIVRPDPKKIDPLFFGYAMIHNQPKIELMGEGATGQTELSRARLGSETYVPVPPLLTQQRIVRILAAYDDLIENNQRRIKTLEAMARAIYQEAVQAGSNPAALRPLVECTYWRFISENVSAYSGTKRYYATADVDGLAVTGHGIDFLFAEKPSRAQKQPIPNSVWFARMKDTYKIAWYAAGDGRRAAETMLSSGFAGFEAVDPELWPLLFLTVSSNEFHMQKDRYCTGATQMSLTNEGLARIEMPIPDDVDARALGRATQPILRQMLLLQEQVENLRRTRDLLLPRLLSGELDVETSAA